MYCCGRLNGSSLLVFCIRWMDSEDEGDQGVPFTVAHREFHHLQPFSPLCDRLHLPDKFPFTIQISLKIQALCPLALHLLILLLHNKIAGENSHQQGIHVVLMSAELREQYFYSAQIPHGKANEIITGVLDVV